MRTPQRQKRTPFNFVGSIRHTLFGLATDSSIEQCKQAVACIGKHQQVIAHQLDILTSVINCTREDVTFNRARLENMFTWITLTLVAKVNQLTELMNLTSMRLYRLERSFYFEKNVYLLEQVSAVYRENVKKNTGAKNLPWNLDV